MKVQANCHYSSNYRSDSSVDDGVLLNSQPINISGAQDEFLYFTFDVPSGASDLMFNLTGGTGDADLYVSFEVAPVKLYMIVALTLVVTKSRVLLILHK